jgi:hypothetical protein
MAQKVNRAAPNGPSVIYDAVLVLGGASSVALAESGLAVHLVNEAYRHGKPIAAIGDGPLLLGACSLATAGIKDGVIIGDDAHATEELIIALLHHRFPRRSSQACPRDFSADGLNSKIGITRPQTQREMLLWASPKRTFGTQLDALMMATRRPSISPHQTQHCCA